MKRFIYACLLAVTLAMPGWAWALCSATTPSGGYWGPWMTGEPKPMVYTAPSFNVSFNPNVPNGTLLFSEQIDFVATEGGRVFCQGGFGGVYHHRWMGVQVPGYPNVYSTPIPGVGYSIQWALNSRYWDTYDNLGTIDTIMVPPGKTSSLRIRFFKTGPITSGGVISGELGRMSAYGGAQGPLLSWRFGGGIVVQPQVPTCRVTTPAITVPLGSMPASTFTGVGSVSPSKPFNIVLQCSGGETGTVTNVYTTLTDHTNPGNVSDTLSLASDATATGIGIQVLNGSTVIKYGPDSSATGNTNQWKAGTTGNGTFTIPLTARYIQTAPKVTAGTADGLATFTMSYQ
ncbi:fimbrial protein [Burkholderia stagnalis]|uniref:fimbrial protein n=2 Tax=Burkholderia stagnalis TaxID=1503054 RepID=UPI000A908B41